MVYEGNGEISTDYKRVYCTMLYMQKRYSGSPSIPACIIVSRQQSFFDINRMI